MQDMRLAVAIGCSVEHVDAIGYAESLQARRDQMTEIGINCRVCPRVNCDQRAHHAVLAADPVDERRRGATRYAN